MERAARLLKKNKRTQQILSPDDMVRGVWVAAVGNTIARHTVRLKVVRSTLVVEVEDATWQKQLFPLSSQIVYRVQKLLGNADIEHVEFRAAVSKRPMRREERPVTADNADQDEAESILDPVLKKVYRNSRKRATA